MELSCKSRDRGIIHLNTGSLRFLSDQCWIGAAVYVDTLPGDISSVGAAQERTNGSEFARVAHSFCGHSFDLIRTRLLKGDSFLFHPALCQPALTIRVNNEG